MIGKKKEMLFVFLLLLFFILPASADAAAVISWGADLTLAQKEQVKGYFPINNEPVQETILTHAEECRYLIGLVPEALLGKRAISSVYVEQLSAGEGIQVETKNTNWVSEEMFRNVLTTAGIKDARVIAAAPYAVSGTAALAGMFKAFEQATGQRLPSDAKQAATKELITTGNLAEDIGNKQKAAELVSLIKEKVVLENLTTPQEIEQAVRETAGKIQIQLTSEQIEQVVNLMKNISSLDLNLQSMGKELQAINEKLTQVLQDNQEVQGMLEKMMDFCKQMFQQLLSFAQRFLAAEK